MLELMLMLLGVATTNETDTDPEYHGYPQPPRSVEDPSFDGFPRPPR